MLFALDKNMCMFCAIPYDNLESFAAIYFSATDAFSSPFKMFLLPVLFACSVLFLCVYLLIRTINAFTYWKRLHVASIEPHYVFGNIKDVLFGRENISDAVHRAYNVFRAEGQRYGGVYFMRRPVFIPTDPRLIRDISIRDFDSFVDRGIETSSTSPLTGHLFSLNGDEWRRLRQKMTSTFTSGKLRGMVDAFNLHGGHLIQRVRDEVDCGSTDIYLNEYFEKVGVDIIGHVAFGLNYNTLNSGDTDFYRMVRRIFKPKFATILRYLLFDDFSNPGNVIALTTSDKEMSAFFVELIADTVRMRKANPSGAPKDFLQLLVDLHVGDELTVDQIAAQTFIFFIAAFETSSKAINFSMYELSKNEALQEELRQELVRNARGCTYDEIMQCKLLDLVLKETLRKHPSVMFLHRKCNKPYRVSPELLLEKDTILLMPIYAVHNDPEYFPKPEVYDPYRFDDERAPYGKVDPVNYYPFGDGPRNCIGMRFGLLQVKIMIAKLILNFRFKPSPKTVEPFRFNPMTDNLLLNYKDPIYYNIEKIST